MSKIKLLTENIINRIAAGEVVERPSSILKELLENSLDAGADQIEIEILSGGKKLIRLKDNGCGMDKDDLFMSLERHATSKITENSDLMNIATLGFRGEALPSIASVSRLSILSASENNEGHLLKINGGRLETIEPASANRGTTITVADLFYNVPARRKFLKTDETEAAHLLDIAGRYALSRPGLSLSFRQGARELISVDKHNNFQTRILKIMGRQAAEQLKPFNFKAADLSISGFLGHPNSASRSTSGLFLYVLGRPVRDRLLTRALSQGYGRLVPSGRWPQAIIFVDIDPAEVDVNVHPAKAEVRFRQPNLIFKCLSETIAQEMGSAPLETTQAYQPSFREKFKTYQPSASAPTAFSSLPKPGPPPEKEQGPPIAKMEKPLDFLPPWMQDETPLVKAALTGSQADNWPLATPENFAHLPNSAAPEEKFQGTSSPKAFFSKTPDEPSLYEGVWPIGQLHNSYILAQGATGLYVIDQHAAHERILFNQLKKRLAENGLPGQQRLFPDTYDLPPHQALAAEQLAPHLLKLGFELNHFGGNTFMLKSAPAILGEIDPWPTLLEILSTAQGQLKGIEGAGLLETLEDLANSWLYSLACRAAIKAGQKMSIEEMAKLLQNLAQTQNGGYCPHGRPAVFILSRPELDKKFHR